MSAYARAPSSNSASDYHESRWELGATDRLGPPLANRRRRRIVIGLALVAMSAGAGWLWHEGRLAWVGPLVTELSTALKSASQRAPSSEPQSAKPQEAALPALEPSRPIAPAPEVAAALATPAPSVPSPEPAPQGEAHPQPSSDPLLRRAEAAGLHPGISRALLERLSADDFRNAGIAVSTAVAETPDDGAFEWPRSRQQRLARFRVLFVPGAADGCRRYVVEIEKDGWLTTALPVEKCGIPGPPR